MTSWSASSLPRREAEKFMFDKVFESEAEQRKKQYRYTEEELTIAKIASHTMGEREGYARGVQETLEGIHRRCADDILGRLDAIMAAQKKLEETLHHHVSRLVTHIAQALMPAYMKQEALTEVAAIIAQAFETIETPQMTVIVHRDLVEPLREHLQGFISSSEQSGNLKFNIQSSGAEEGFEKSDCRIEWQGGGLERQEERLKQEVQKALERLEAHEPVSSGAILARAVDARSEDPAKGMNDTDKADYRHDHGS